jgi:hypothetical protein
MMALPLKRYQYLTRRGQFCVSVPGWGLFGMKNGEVCMSKQNSLPAGYVKVKLVLPEHQAVIVQGWGAEAEKLIKQKKKK